MVFVHSFLLPHTGYKILDVLSLVAIVAISVLLATYGITSIQFWLERKRNVSDRKGREPPTPPYWIPYIGHMLQMGNLHSLCDYAAYVRLFLSRHIHLQLKLVQVFPFIGVHPFLSEPRAMLSGCLSHCSLPPNHFFLTPF